MLFNKNHILYSIYIEYILFFVIIIFVQVLIKLIHWQKNMWKAYIEAINNGIINRTRQTIYKNKKKGVSRCLLDEFK